MSLDVYLMGEGTITCECCGHKYDATYEVFAQNITHNLNEMADQAGLYDVCWRPHRLRDDYDIPEGDHEGEWEFEDSVEVKAGDLIKRLEKGLKALKDNPEHFKRYNASNGWGVYENFVPWVERYLEACKEYPDAVVRVSR